MDIKKLRRARGKEATVDLWGNPLKVWYLPQSLSPKMLRELRESQASLTDLAKPTPESAEDQLASVVESLESAEGSVQALVTTFLATVTDWDLTSGGVKVELTAEGLDEIELDILSEILRQLREQQSPNGQSGMPTNAPS